MISHLPAISVIENDLGRLTGVSLLAKDWAVALPTDQDAVAAAAVAMYVNDITACDGDVSTIRVNDLQTAARLLRLITDKDEEHVAKLLRDMARRLVDAFEQRIEAEAEIQ